MLKRAVYVFIIGIVCISCRHKPNDDRKVNHGVSPKQLSSVGEFLDRNGYDSTSQYFSVPDTFIEEDLATLRSYRNLKEVDLSFRDRNLIGKIIRDIEIDSNLETLILRVDDDSIIIPASIYRLKSVKEVHIFCRTFKSAGSNLDFSPFAHLDHLGLDAYNIVDCKIKLPSTILKALELGSGIKDVPVNFFNHHRINELSLFNNKIERLNPNIRLNNVDSIYLGANPIAERFYNRDTTLTREVKAFGRTNPNTKVKFFEELGYK